LDRFHCDASFERFAIAGAGAAIVTDLCRDAAAGPPCSHFACSMLLFWPPAVGWTSTPPRTMLRQRLLS
jgi:hypothetical protein